MNSLTTFIHLNVHTEFSIVDGIVRIGELLDTCTVARMPAIAITDQCNLFGLIKFYKAALSHGIKPIIGMDIKVLDKQSAKTPYKLTFLAQNQTGYKNLIQLISKAYIEGQREDLPLIEKSWFAEKSEGLLALSGGIDGDIGRAVLSNDHELASKLLLDWKCKFPARFYLELQRVGKPNEEEYITKALDLADKYGVPVVATNGVCFLRPNDFEAHEARVCINAGNILDDPKRPRLYTEQQYLRSADEMITLFSDIPEAVINTVEIAKRCNVKISLGETFLPIFPIPKNTSMEDYFAKQAKLGLDKRLGSMQQRKVYDARLAFELKVINTMGFSSYFLIVADFIAWAKNNGIPVGPGRGSGAGSLVAYALGITDLDPIQHELLFERFLNPERVSLPDFDIDFCMDGRDRVIEYVMNRYGRDKVSQIITYGTMAARAVVRDVGRVLGFPYGFVDKIAKLIPFELGITLERALQEDTLKQRYEDESEVKMLIDLAKKLEGITRNAGKHAGGVIIAPSLLTDFLPLYREADDANLVSQFDKDDVEAIGLVKFDFLGLRTLTIINWALQIINQKKQQINEPPIDINKLPLDDAATYKLLQDCATIAVFQLESRGLRDLIKRLKPDRFSDIVALVALYRPGPLQSGMVDDFVNRKDGRAQVSYLHPLLENILKPTYGVILYQEQVMQIAQVLAGYSLGSADILRKAMGKKKPEEMAKQRAIFLEGAEKNNVNKHIANSIFDLMEKFAGYGFNKSHSAAYALITYQTAWLKVHYPSEFMAAVLSSDMDNTDKVVLFLRECEKMGLTVIPPDINQGDYKFTVNEKQEIKYGLGAIKGVGMAALENTLANRRENGSFKNLFDFCKRVDTRKANKKVLEALIKAGALDSIGPARGAMLASIPLALKCAEQHANSGITGQMDLFADSAEDNDLDEIAYADVPELTEGDRLKGEKNVLGFYLSGHPFANFKKDLAPIISITLSDIVRENSDFSKAGFARNVIIAGLVAAIKNITTKSGNRMAVVTLEDDFSNIDVTVFAELYFASRNLLEEDRLLVIEGELGIDNYTGQQRMRASKIMTLEEARCTYAKSVTISMSQLFSNSGISKIFDELQKMLSPFLNGNTLVYIDYKNQKAATKLILGERWKVNLKDDLFHQLKNVFGEENITVYYS